MMFQTWTEALRQSFLNMWSGLISFVPNLIGAIIIFIIGWALGSALSKVIAQIVKSIKLDDALRSAGVGEIVHRAGLQLNSGKFIGELVKWFIIVVFLVFAFNILGLTQVNIFLQQVVIGYLPNVIAAVFILLVSAVIGDVVQKVISRSGHAAGIRTANLLGSIAKWAIWVFAILASLYQLGIAAALIQTLFTGIVIAVSLALGLSFGLGGQAAASRYIEKVQHEISDRK